MQTRGLVDTHPALTQTFNLDPSHTPWKDRLETLLQTGVRAGADLVEVFLERTDHLGVLAEQERITSVSPSFGMGAGIRVFLGHRCSICTVLGALRRTRPHT